MYNNYQSIKQSIRSKQSFNGNSAIGYYDKALGYTVKSYNTIIYSDVEGLSVKQYSSTTSRIQNLIAQSYYNKTIKQLRKEALTLVKF